MTKVKIFVYGRRRQGYDNSSPDFRHGELIKLYQHRFEYLYTCINW